MMLTSLRAAGLCLVKRDVRFLDTTVSTNAKRGTLSGTKFNCLSVSSRSVQAPLLQPA
jgi:hypothetical protein